jgi:DNA segregation ATPase FtsK/SpoIIIE-like protein
MRDQMVDLATRGHPTQPRAALPAKATEQLSAPAAAPDVPATTVALLPEIAPWALLDQWPGGKLPLGITDGGPVQHDPEGMAAHLLYAGTTGSGKTRYGLRPLIAEALADRWQVIILDRSGVDFQVFADHPNAHLVRVDEPGEVGSILERAYRELITRLRSLAAAGASTWGRSNNQKPRVLIVIDEFSNLADDAQPEERAELWRRARIVAAEGRKAGILLALALQDPTYKSMDLRIRRNCTCIAFRVQDAAASRLILNAGGAESLAPHRFMTTAGGLVSGVAFAPDDGQIREFINRRMAPAYPAPEWLFAPIEPEEQGAPEEERARKIIELHSGGASLNEIQRQVFGFTGGQAYSAVKAVLLRSTGTDTGIDTAVNQNIAPSAA